MKLFICCLFNDAFNVTECTRRMIKWLVNNELRRMLKEAVLV
jgi:hypothetical protein